MISEFNTNNNLSSTGNSGGMDLILKIAVIGAVIYFGYKYLIIKPTEEKNK